MDLRGRGELKAALECFNHDAANPTTDDVLALVNQGEVQAQLGSR
jgi:hypothetical protein